MQPALARPRWWSLVAALLALAVGLVSLGPAVTAQADDLDDRRRAAEEKQRQTERELEEISHELEELSEELAEAVLELRRVEKRLPVAQAELKAAQDAYDKARREVKALEDRLEAQERTEAGLVERIEQDEARSREVRASVGALARQALKGELGTSTLAIMLDAADPQEFVREYGLAAAALRTQTQLLDELAQADAANRNVKVRLEAVRERIDQLRADAVVKRDEADAWRREAEEHEREVRALIAEQRERTAFIESRKEEAEAKERQLRKDRQALERDIKEIIRKQKEKAERERRERERRERERQEQGRGGGGGGGGGGNQQPGSLGKGFFRNPSSYEPMYVTSSYGWRLHPVLGVYRLHSGIDLRAYCGMNILAGRSGTVVWAKYRSGYGNQVLVDHGIHDGRSVMSSYNHLQSFTVGAGASVSAGTVVGRSGSTGTSTACHLHFEVYVDGVAVDPAPYLP